MRLTFINNLIIKATGHRLFIQKVSRANENDEFQRLKKYSEDKNDFKLHFGCGPRVLKGWINIDLVYEPYESYLKYYGDEYYPESIRGTKADFYEFNSIELGLPLPDDSVNLIFHEDFLEHLTQKEQVLFLAETYRVMKKGAIHRVNTPNLIASMRKWSDFNKGHDGVYVDEWDKNIHHLVMTKKYLEEIALLIGYSQVVFTQKNTSLSKDLPKEYRPAGDRDELDGNIFADLIK